MDIIYISALSSKRNIENLHQKTGENPGFAVQKFNRLLVRGLIENKQSVIALSNPPITRSNTKSFIHPWKNEVEDNIRYKYIPFFNISFIKHICVFLYVFFYVLFWGFRNRSKKCVICDSLSISASLAALIATKVNRVKCCGIFTDIYGLIVGNKSKSIINKLATRLHSNCSKMFTHYVLLTDEMNSVVNSNKRPYIVMEAVCDNSEYRINSFELVKSPQNIFLYAGGIEEKYGLKMLVDAFILAKDLTAELHIYGSGSYVPELLKQCRLDNRVKYLGVVSNEEILEAEKKAIILINPRFTSEEFTKYSFPSKNMEYMVSGTPVLTTRLPGMPKEYYDYVYFFEGETKEAYALSLRRLMDIDPEELVSKGNTAKSFVLREKNNIKQTIRILEMLQ